MDPITRGAERSAPLRVLRRASSEASYRLGEHAFRFRTEFDDLAEVLDDLLAPHRCTTASGETVYEAFRADRGAHDYSVTRDGVLECRAGTFAAALDYVLWDVTRRAIDRTSLLAVHAGAVARAGRAIVFPAAMDSGKTTLVTGLVADGFAYLSDEAALVDPQSGLVHPFAKPLWMEARTLNLIPGLATSLPRSHLWMMKQNFHVAAAALAGGTVTEPCRVAAVIAPRYSDGVTTTLEPLGKADALMLLAENCFNLARFGTDGIAALSRIVEDAPCYRLTVGDLADAVAAVRRL